MRRLWDLNWKSVMTGGVTQLVPLLHQNPPPFISSYWNPTHPLRSCQRHSPLWSFFWFHPHPISTNMILPLFEPLKAFSSYLYDDTNQNLLWRSYFQKSRSQPDKFLESSISKPAQSRVVKCIYLNYWNCIWINSWRLQDCSSRPRVVFMEGTHTSKKTIRSEERRYGDRVQTPKHNNKRTSKTGIELSPLSEWFSSLYFRINLPCSLISQEEAQSLD